MRPRGSLVGPLIVILIGVLFLLRTVVPDFRVWDLFRMYWPYLLIAWGVLSLIEICVRFTMGSVIPSSGVSGGSWVFVVLICLVGWAAFQFGRQDTWWHHFTMERGFQAFGDEHEFSVPPQQAQVPAAPHVVVERFRGDAKITASDASEVSVSGHKSVRAFGDSDADRANSQSPVQMTVQGSTVVIRCNQDRANPHADISTSLDITVPKDASVEVTGTHGDFEVSGIVGDLDVSTENGGVRVQDMGGSVKVDSTRSDLIRCVNVKGTVDLRGHGDDVELSNIAGQVTISGDYTGTLSLHDLSKPVRVQDRRTQLEVQRIPGEVRIERGDVSLQNIIGPSKLNTHDTDVTVEGVSNELSMDVDKGDIEVRPGRVPLGKMTIRTRSGNIELALPETAEFMLNANTDRGEIDNEFGDALKEQTQGRGAHLQGTTGSGPDVLLNTGRGSITVRKATPESNPGTKVAGVAGRKQRFRPGA